VVKDKFTTMSNEDYHESDAISTTDVKRILVSPYHFRYHVKPAVTPRAFVVGSATHALYLEPLTFDEKYRVKPLEVDGQGPRTKHYKEWLFHQDPAITWLDAETHALVVGMADAAHNHPISDACFGWEHVVEGSLFFNLHGVHCKARPDLVAMRGDGTVDVVDLKTTQDASPEGFRKVAWNLGYGIQHYVYAAGLRDAGFKVNRFIFLAVEKAAPYACCAHVLEKEWVYGAGEKVRQALHAYDNCMENNVWPSYGEAINELSLPAWAGGKRKESASNGWLTVREAMTLMGISRSTLYHWFERGVKRKKLGGRVLVDAAALEETMTGS